MNSIWYLCRHGETALNAQKIIQGSGVDAPLNEKGLLQANKLGLYYANTFLDAIVVSGLQRTMQTIAPLKQFHPNCKVYSFPAFNEFSWGIYEGLPYTSHIETHEELLNAWRKGDYDAKMPKGESVNEVAIRLKKGINSIQKLNITSPFICMHGRSLRLLLSILLETSYSNMEQYEHTNTSVYVLKFENNAFTLLKHNDLTHLQ